MKGLGWLLVVASFGAVACGDSGQTGSASCAAPCQCEYLANFHLAKATVLGVDGSKVTIRVDQSINEVAGDAPYEPQELTGTIPSPSWCMPTQLALPNVGDEVFAAFTTSGDVVLRVQPWADEIALADGSLVSLAEAVDLSDAPTCYARYAAPCNDTPTGGEGGEGCAVSVSGSRSPTAPGLAVAALMLVGFAQLRRRLR